MRDLLNQLIGYLTGLGGFGIVLLAALDSSILFLPFAVDLLLIAQAARHNEISLVYAALATVGSTIGSCAIWFVARKGGEPGLERLGSKRRLERVRSLVKRRGVWMLGLAALMPPPFPYRLFVAAAAVGGMPFMRMMLITGAGRMLRFGTEALLSRRYGNRIIRFMDESDTFFYTVSAIAVLSVVGSAVSIVAWARKRS